MKNKRYINWLIITSFSPLSLAPILVASKCNNKSDESEVEQLKKEIADLKNQLSNSKNHLEAKIEEINKLSLQNQEANNQVIKLRKNQEQNLNKIQELHLKVNELEEENNKLNKQLQNLNDDHEQLVVQKAELEEKIKNLQNELTLLKNLITELEVKLGKETDSNEELVLQIKQNQEKISELNKNANTLNQQLQDLEAQLTHKDSEIEKQKKEIDALNDNINKLQTSIKQIKEQNNKLSVDLQAAKATILANEKKINELNNSNVELKTKNQALEKEIAKLKEDLNNNSNSNDSEINKKPIAELSTDEEKLLQDALKVNLFSLNNSTYSSISKINNPADLTKGEAGFNYGTVPLVHKTDEQITKSDLKDMFNYIASSNNIYDYSFGDRKINTNIIAEAYSEWFYENWKYFPYYSLSNVSLKFEVSDNNTYATKIYRPLIAFDWQGQSTYYESFKNFIKNGLALIKPGMQDYDKAFVLWQYTSSYLQYVLKDVLIRIEKAVLTQSGVCANYAHLYSLLLNLAGVTAMPIITGQGIVDPTYHGETHQVAYIKLRLPGTQEAMWYLSDATWAKDATLKYQKTPLAYSPQNGISYHEFLLPIGKSFDKPLNQSQFSNGEFFSLPWPELFNKEDDNVKYVVGDYEFKIDEENKTVLSPVFKQGYMYNYILERAAGDISDSRSAYQFNNGKFYALRSVKRTDGIHKTFIKQDLNSNTPEVVDWYELIDDAVAIAQIQASMSNGQIDRTNNLLSSYKDKFILVGNNYVSNKQKVNKCFYVVLNSDSSKWIKIEVPDAEKEYITNFYANDEGIFYSLNFSNQYHKLVMNSEQKNFYQTTVSKHQKQQDLINYAKLKQVEINSYLIGALPGQINIKDVKQFNNLVEYCIKNIEIIDLSVAKNLIDKLVSEYKKTNNIQKLMLSSSQNEIINRPKAQFQEYGLSISNLMFQNLEEIAHPKFSLLYVTVLGSETKDGSYSEIMKNIPADALYLRSEDITPNIKFLKFRYSYEKDSTDFYETKPIFLNLNAQSSDSNMSIMLLNTYQYSNYTNKMDWANQPVTMELVNFELNNPDYEMYFISKEKKVTKLNVKDKQISLGTINQTNAGIYFTVKKVRFKGVEYKQYSNYFFALTKTDINDPQINELFLQMQEIAKQI
ncbi:hypothetical protein ACNQ1N_00095 [Mycoplasma sp. HF11B]|uniref:hypothetical protein n=1 Tax=Mycoplasma sp. HF11B TaxID=3401681 RepID=UPI003AAA468F